MSSPAEILALQHAQAQSNDFSAPPSTATSQAASVVESVTTAATDDEEDVDKLTNIHSDNDNEDDDFPAPPVVQKSFPVLGSSSHVSSSAALNWGPGSKVSVTSTNSNGSTVKKAFSPSHVKATNTQVTFIIAADQQLNITKPELFKILGNVKKNFNVNVESTFSNTSNKRTFLLTGPPANTERAKREIVKQLTKPVRIEFKIPSKLRSTVIGAQGKNLKPIIESTGVKIDITRGDDEQTTTSSTSDDDEDLFGALIPVVINGDIEGCEEAKSKILQIVKENTKSLSVRVPVIEKLSPFIANELDNLTNLPTDVAVTALSKQNTVVINGPRDSAITARDIVKELIDSLNKSIVIENRNVPKTAHQFLNPKVLFEKVNVKVEIPDSDSNSNIVVFTGTKQNIQKAIELGKSLADDYITDALDIGRSHGGNSDHAKNLISYFKYVKFFDELSEKYNINIISPSYKWLSDRSTTNTTPAAVVIQFSCFKDQKGELKKARKEIIDNVNKITPSFIRSIDDISSFIINKNKALIEDSHIAKSNNVTVVPLSKLANVGNKIILVLNQDDDEFLPSIQEINDKLDQVGKSLDELREASKKVKTQVIDIPAEDQAKINEASLRIIANKFDNNSIDIKLNQNDKGYSKDEILLIGFEKEINASISEINQLIDDIRNYETASKYNTLVKFPTQHLSKLIGQKGVNLKAISEEFDVKIDVRDDDSSAEESNIKLTGVKSNVDECIKKVQQLNKRFSDEKTVIMKVENKYHGKIIGKNGSYANRLRDKYNVVLRFPTDGSSSNKDEITIRGPSKSVVKVEDEIKELVQYEKENGFESTIKVPVDILPRVIGKNGELINDISADAGIEIHTNHKRNNSSNESSKEEFSEIQLIGSKKGIKEATDRINSLVTRISNYTTVTLNIDPKWHKNLIGQGGSVKREIVKKAGGNEDNMSEFRKLLQIPNKDSESKEIILSGDKNIIDKIIEQINKLVEEYERVTKDSVQVPKKKHKLLIGFRGAVKRNIQDDFNVFIDIPNIDSESDLISIKGLPENIEKAKAKIAELIA